MPEPKPALDKESIPFYPDHVRTEVRVMIGIIILAVLIGTLGLISPVGLGEPADPMDTPAHVKPEWYFLALYQLLKYIPKTAGVIIPLVLLVLVTFWPFIDRRRDTSPKIKWVRFAVVAVGMLILIALTVWGEVS